MSCSAYPYPDHRTPFRVPALLGVLALTVALDGLPGVYAIAATLLTAFSGLVSTLNAHLIFPGLSEALRSSQEQAEQVYSQTQRLADLVLVTELPRSAIGKVLKRDLRDAYSAASAKPSI